MRGNIFRELTDRNELHQAPHLSQSNKQKKNKLLQNKNSLKHYYDNNLLLDSLDIH